MSDYATMEAQYIRARLEKLKAQIEGVGHGATMGYWVGDVAGERRHHDDWAAGRAFWHTAWSNANAGLEASAEGNHDRALNFLLEAQAMAIDALGSRLRPDDLKQLAKPAKARGRKKTA